MKTHMLSEVPIVKRVKVKTAGSATAGVNVSFFLFTPAGGRQKFKVQHSRPHFFGAGGICHSIWGHTHLPYDGVQPTAESRFHLCMVVFIHSRSYEDRYRSRWLRSCSCVLQATYMCPHTYSYVFPRSYCIPARIYMAVGTGTQVGGCMHRVRY
jgi:hypothetical protein